MNNKKQTQVKRKVLAVLLAAVMLSGSAAVALPVIGSDSGIVASASTYQNFEYEENDDGGITITKYYGSDKEVVIPGEIGGKSVTSIGDYAFFSCTNLTSVTIPDSVTSIGVGTFYGCTSLTNVNVDARNSDYCSIGGILFNKNQTKLICYPAGRKDKSYKIPDGVESIGNAFYNYENLTTIIIPDSVKLGVFDLGFVGDMKAKNLTIVGSKGSSAEQYADHYRFEFISITDYNHDTEQGTSETVATSVKFNKSTLTLEKGKSETILFTISPSNTTNKTVAWASSDDKVATVKDGKVTAVAAGTATITAKTSNGKTAKCTVTVKNSTVSIKTVTLKTTSYTYDGKAKTPAVTVKDANGKTVASSNYTVEYSNNKNVGMAKVIVTGKGNYTGKVTKTFKIVPKTVSLKSVTSPKTKQLKATWAKNTTATGYQIQYSTNSKFTSGNKTKIITKNSTTNTTITGVTKGKTYYVRVRAYKTVGKTKVYGAYSTAKKVKIK